MYVLKDNAHATGGDYVYKADRFVTLKRLHMPQYAAYPALMYPLILPFSALI